jgi:hypothetical protein
MCVVMDVNNRHGWNRMSLETIVYLNLSAKHRVSTRKCSEGRVHTSNDCSSLVDNANNLLVLSSFTGKALLSSDKVDHLVRVVDVGCVTTIPGDCYRAVCEPMQRAGT